MSGEPGQLDWQKGHGLLPAIVQDYRSGVVLMCGFMSPESLEKTKSLGRVTFFSRTRQALWTKGETSGNYLELVEITPDCDRDCLLVTARPTGPVCHLGTDTCFEGVDNPSAGRLAFLAELESIIHQRLESGSAESYTARLAAAGSRRIAQKVGEEAVEVALASTVPDDDALTEETADLLYHLLLLLNHRGISLGDVVERLAARHESAHSE